MTDNLRLGPDAQANHALSILRDGTSEGGLASDVEISPGVHAHADPALGLDGSWRSPEGRLLEIEARMAAPGGWFGLHIDLPTVELGLFGVVGFACRSVSPEMHLIRACLRSGTPTGFHDSFFDKHLLTHREESSHIDAMPIQQRGDLPRSAPWRELVLFLPTQTFTLSLQDFRVFVV